MIFYKYQRSRSFIDLCPRLLRLSTFIFSSKTAGLIETKFHEEPLLEREMKNCSNDQGHMVKMAAMPIYGKNIWKTSQAPNADYLDT